jgi:hypothetical protein
MAYSFSQVDHEDAASDRTPEWQAVAQILPPLTRESGPGDLPRSCGILLIRSLVSRYGTADAQDVEETLP